MTEPAASATAPPSPLPITSRAIRARLDQLKAELSASMRARLDRDATWNEVLGHLLDVHDGWRAEARGRE